MSLAGRTLGSDAPETVLADGKVEVVLTRERLTQFRNVLAGIFVREELVAYVVDIIRATRRHESVLVGAGPRATQALLLAARAHAVICERDYVSPDDIKSLALPVVAHRLVLRPEYEIEGPHSARDHREHCPAGGRPEMITPRGNLLWWTGGWLIPLAVAAAVAPASAPLVWSLAGVAMILPLFDLLWADAKLRGLSIEHPEIARMTKDQSGSIEVHIVNKSAKARRVRLAMAVPKAVGCEAFDMDVALPDGSARSSVSFECSPTRRGSFRAGPCYLGAASPLGFWLKHRSWPASVEVRVYPNLAPERKRMASMFLNRGPFGMHARRQIGIGREFEQLRDYIPGDSYDQIHWKATAKRRRPATKVFQMERTQEVYVVVDSSRLSARLWPESEQGRRRVRHQYREGHFGRPRAGHSRPVAGRPVRRYELQRPRRQVRPGPQRQGALRACRDALYALQPRPVAPDFAELFSFIRTRMRRRALLMFLTSLDDPIVAEQFAEGVSLISRQHLVLVNMIRPPDARPLFEAPDVGKVEDIHRRLGGHLRFARLEEIAKVLKRRAVGMSLLENERLCPQVVAQYVNVKRRQML